MSHSSFHGIAAVMLAQLFISTQDMLVKWLSDTYPLHEIVLVRSIAACVVMLLIFFPREGAFWRSEYWRMHLLRGACVVVANTAFFSALASMPLGEVVAIFFIAPVLITLLSVLMLDERVGPWRWGAVAIGLLGVLVMVRPRGGVFQLAALLPVLAATAYALVNILTRRVGQRDSASTMAFYIQAQFVVVSMLVGLIFGDGAWADPDSPIVNFLLRPWVWPAHVDIGIMVGIGLLSGAGGYFVSYAYRSSAAATIAPFEYVAMPLALFWSAVMFGDWPDALSWVGIVLIIAAGLLTAYREQVRGVS